MTAASTATQEDIDVFRNFSFAIMAVFVSLVSDVSIRFGEHLQQLLASEFWTKNDEKLNEGLKAVRKATLQSITLSMLVVVASAVAVSLPSRHLDQRMTYILEGLSLIFGAVVFGGLSAEVAVWTGVYYKIWPHPGKNTAKTLKELQLKVRFSFYRIFVRYFFFLLPFFQGVTAVTIPASILAGIAMGLAVDVGVYLCRRKHKRTRKIASGIFTFIIICASSTLMAIGVWYIALVWENIEDPTKDLWFGVSFALCFFGLVSLHITRGWISRKRFAKEDTSAADISSFPTKSTVSNLDPLAPNRPRMAASLFFEKRQTDGEDRSDPNKQEDHLGDPQEQEETNEVEEETESNGGGTDHQDLEVQDDALDTEELDHGEEEDDDIMEPTLKQMLCAWKCCGCVRRDDRTPSEKAYSFLEWTVWFVLVCFSLWLVIVNSGATVQQDAARAKLPFVDSEVYKYMDEGPVCAFDNKGPDSNITTFPNKDSAHAEGFLIVHCGECGTCSDWHNLRVNYETREYLATESARCAKKSLFGGADAVLECLELPPIKFQGQCAICWVEDILCTKGFCAFIYLQSIMIKTAGNFQVSTEMITSASCEEAHCEAGNPGDFVYCSGATRRRMNVTSTIDRPGIQHCGIVDVVWSEVFGS